MANFKSEYFDPLVTHSRIEFDSWENIIARAEAADSEAGLAFERFYEASKAFAGASATTAAATPSGLSVSPSTEPLEGIMPIQYGHSYMYREQPVLAVGVGANHARVVPIQYDGEYFPESFLIDTQANLPAGPLQVDQDSLRPQLHEVYLWSPPIGPGSWPRQAVENVNPPVKVRITVRGWHTSKVALADAAPVTFYVYNHHVRRNC